MNRQLVTIVLLLGSAAFAAGPSPLRGQTLDAPAPTDTIYELRHLTGLRTLGWIAEQRGDTVLFRSIEGGEWRLDRRTANLRRARGRVVEGEFWREDQNHSRLFFAPTGRPLHEGQGYGGVFAILPFVGYGITEDFTLAGGIPPWGGTLNQFPMWVAPKLRIHNEPGLQGSVGGLYLQLPGSDPFTDAEPLRDEMFRIGVAYGVATLGEPDRAFHIGAGAARSFGTAAATRALLMVGGEGRLGRRVKLISENWFVTPEHPLLSLGLRSVGERWTFDYGLMAVLSEPEAPLIPIFSFSYAFGTGR